MDPSELIDRLSPSGRRVVVRDFAVEAFIGVYAQEYEQRQTVIISLDLFLDDDGTPARFVPDTPRALTSPALRAILCYDALTTAIRGLIEAGHIELVETLAEDIAALCLSDGRVAACRVRVEKPDAIAGARRVGVEVLRRRVST